jgi:hypothetical protein
MSVGGPNLDHYSVVNGPAPYGFLRRMRDTGSLIASSESESSHHRLLFARREGSPLYNNGLSEPVTKCPVGSLPRLLRGLGTFFQSIKA